MVSSPIRFLRKKIKLGFSTTVINVDTKCTMCSSVNKVVLPGDELEGLQESERSHKVILGPGLLKERETVFVSKPGVLKFKHPNVYWIDSKEKRYIPARGDGVIGTVVKAGNVFRVHFGGCALATLSYLAFEGATKRNRPDVKVGDLIYGKFVVVGNDMESELTCVDSHGRSNGLGVLRGDNALMMTCSASLCRQILSPDCVLMKTLGKKMPFDSVVGLNGRIWLNTRSVEETAAVMNFISAAENMSNEQITRMCDRLVESLAGFSPEDMDT